MDNNADTITKEYKVNASVLVTYHTLNSLYQNFFSIYPKELGNKIVDLINDLKDNLEFEQENDCKGYDIKNSYYEKVIYIKSDSEDEN